MLLVRKVLGIIVYSTNQFAYTHHIYLTNDPSYLILKD